MKVEQVCRLALQVERSRLEVVKWVVWGSGYVWTSVCGGGGGCSFVGESGMPVHNCSILPIKFLPSTFDPGHTPRQASHFVLNGVKQ